MIAPEEERPPLVWIEERKWLVLNDGAIEHYDINLEQFNTSEGTQKWLQHLEGKQWFTRAHRAQMLALLETVQNGCA
jgi:hypothetical protein